VATRQVAEVTLPTYELERLWTPEYLERLAATYWRYLTRVSCGLLRVIYTPATRELVLVRRPFVLLRLRAPEYNLQPTVGAVTWRIERGILVARTGRGQGYLRIVVQRPSRATGEWVTARVSSEVANFYPTLALASSHWSSRVGSFLYTQTQLRLHVLITHGFLRSLARLELAPSTVGALRDPNA
jgi:hypothetical protein